MSYLIQPSGQFKKDVKKLKKRGYKLSLLTNVISLLSEGESLPARYKDHKLVGNFCGYRECHIEPDWLLIYRTEEDKLVLVLTRTDTHSDVL